MTPPSPYDGDTSPSRTPRRGGTLYVPPRVIQAAAASRRLASTSASLRPVLAGTGQRAGNPAGQTAGRRPDAQDADGQGLEPRPDAGRGARPQGQRLRERPRSLPLDRSAAQRRRAGRRVHAGGPSAQVGHGLRHDHHDAARCRRGRERQPHQPVARQGRRRRGGRAACVPRGPEPAVRHGTGGRHLLCRQHRWHRGLPLHRGRRPHHRAGPTACRVQAGRPLDAQPAAQPRQAEALCRRGIPHQHRRERHGCGAGPRRHLRARSFKRQQPHLRLRPAQRGRHGLGAQHGRPLDGGQRARWAGRRDAARLPDLGAGGRLLRLALLLLGPDGG